MMDKEFMLAFRQALLLIVDAIERCGRREGWYTADRTAALRKKSRMIPYVDDETVSVS